MSGAQLRAFDFFFCPAVAAAQPHNSSDLSAPDSQHGQATKSLSGNVFSDASHNAVVLESRRFEIKPEEAQQREGSFRGIPLSGARIQGVSTQPVNA
jgi:hypothetical protein